VRAVFGFALGLGTILLLAWIVAVAVAGSVEGWANADPDARFGLTGRRVVGAVFGFGMAGLSAAFAGWPMVVATLAALAGAAVAGVIAGLAK
jgi:CHASE2 domain-containing sensor protein